MKYNLNRDILDKRDLIYGTFKYYVRVIYKWVIKNQKKEKPS